MKAIVNGSTNFILTKIFEEGLDFKTGADTGTTIRFCRSNPKLDIEGYDAVNKWTFLLTHAYGIIENPETFLFNGIQNIHFADAIVAKAKNQQIKLVAQAQKLKECPPERIIRAGESKLLLFYHNLVDHDDHLAFVKNEYNGVVIESSFADKQFFMVKEPAGFPTASAVLSDISALRYQYKYEYKKLYHQSSP
jgi:homoserine dehydrogenase